MDTGVAVVQSPVMPEHRRGEEARFQILAELADMYLRFDPTPTVRDLCVTLKMSRGSLEFHARKLRALGHIHPSALWITRDGFAWIQNKRSLTN